MARIRKTEGEISQLRNQIDTFQERLGEVTFLNYIHKEEQGQDAIDYIEKLIELEKQLVDQQEELKKHQAESFEEYESTEETIVKAHQCPKCGKTNAPNTKFCAECGQKLS